MPVSNDEQINGHKEATSMRRSLRHSACWVLLCLAVSAVQVAAQDYGNRLGTNEQGLVSYYATGPSMQRAAFEPALKRWYLPQEIADEYRWQWEYTNYARENYRRYMSPQQEGDHFYDVYGRYLTQGWLVYDWRQRQPANSGGRVC